MRLRSRIWLQYGNWTPEQLVKAGYAVAWMRYRAEINNTYGPALKETSRQGRQLFNRGPYEYDDAIAIVKYVKTLPYIDPNRVGYLGLSHGGEMAFKIAASMGFKTGICCGMEARKSGLIPVAVRLAKASAPRFWRHFPLAQKPAFRKRRVG